MQSKNRYRSVFIDQWKYEWNPMENKMINPSADIVSSVSLSHAEYP